MCTGLIISVLGLVGIIPFYFLSVEHQKLQRRYGKEKKETTLARFLASLQGGASSRFGSGSGSPLNPDLPFLFSKIF